MIEIERKFLVLSDEFIAHAYAKSKIAQGYISTNPERTVRVRVKGNKGFLTIKGAGNESGLSRYEWEKEIDLLEAEQLLKLCEKGVIDKVRHEIKVGEHVYEVDVFEGKNEGLVVAEIELEFENEVFEKPDWLGIEVTGIDKYYNAYLSKKPFSAW